MRHDAYRIISEMIDPKTGYEFRKNNNLWKDLEKDIQNQSDKKDPNFELTGSWKKFYRDVNGFKVYLVDGDWVRHNLSVIFGHGGHGLVHEFIPKDEIWIDSYHRDDCGCKGISKDRRISERYLYSCILHEITEFIKMSKGTPYEKAHSISNKAEIDLRLLKMPDEENYNSMDNK